MIAEGRIFIDVALGLILFRPGSRLDYVLLRHDRWLSLVAINNMASFLLFVALLPLLHFSRQAATLYAILHPRYSLLGSVLVGVALAWLLDWVLSRADQEDAFSLVVGFVMLGVGMAKMANLSPLMVVLTLGKRCPLPGPQQRDQ